MRRPRILKKDANYYVIATINRYENIFKSDEIKSLFLKIVKLAKMKYQFSIKNFCILENNIQFIIQPKEKSCLSQIMQWILSVFAMAYNRIHKIHGHVWYDRFKSEIIEHLNQFNIINEMIKNYPVLNKIVKNAQEYRFGGFYYIINRIYDIIEENNKVELLI